MKLQTFEQWWKDKSKYEEDFNGRNYSESERLLAKSAWDECQAVTEQIMSIPAFFTEPVTCKEKHSNSKSFGSYIECLDCGSIYFSFDSDRK